MGQFGEYIKMALYNLKENKGRSFLTMLGIIIGISSVIQLTESYNGVHKFEYQDQVFKVSILLNAKTEKGAIAR